MYKFGALRNWKVAKFRWRGVGWELEGWWGVVGGEWREFVESVIRQNICKEQKVVNASFS